jgi:hypothetical protein
LCGRVLIALGDIPASKNVAPKPMAETLTLLGFGVNGATIWDMARPPFHPPLSQRSGRFKLDRLAAKSFPEGFRPPSTQALMRLP